ncbi:hypothetical protein TWF730_006512 [Orbilia blumenaviensis]
MACKAIDCSANPIYAELASREITTWSAFSISEKYIASFGRDATWTDRTKTIKLYMELYPGGDLQRVITACMHQESTVHPFIATYWAMEIARGLRACHDRGIIHRDLKPGNVLLSIPYTYNDVLWKVTGGWELSDNDRKLGEQFCSWFQSRPPWCHISDFGFGKFTPAAYLSGQHSRGSLGTVGTVGYLAPEVLGEEPKFSVRSDVYSFGCLVYSLCTSKPPPASHLREDHLLEIGSMYPKRLKDIIARAVKFDPEDRPGSRELLNEVTEAFIDIQEDGILGFIRYSIAYSERTKPQYSPDVQRKLDDLLRRAVATENCELMETLIDAGADVNADSFSVPRYEHREGNIWNAIHAFKDGVVQKLRWLGNSHSKGRSAPGGDTKFPLITAAAFNGSHECLDLLLKRGAIREESTSRVDPLSAAACSGYVQIIDNLVLKWDFDIDALSVNAISWKGLCTPLALAAQVGSVSGVRRLLELKASASICGSGRNYPLHDIGVNSTASGQDLLACVQLLCEAAPQVINLRNHKGQTPLHRLIQECRLPDYSIVELLLCLGADPKLCDLEGHNVYDLGEVARNRYGKPLLAHSTWQTLARLAAE